MCAIMIADDELLKDMGLLKAGDRSSLRGFCRSRSQSEKKEDNQNKKRLLQAFFEKRKEGMDDIFDLSPCTHVNES